MPPPLEICAICGNLAIPFALSEDGLVCESCWNELVSSLIVETDGQAEE